MYLQLVIYGITALPFFVGIFFWYYLRKSRILTEVRKLPGPPLHPIFGNLLDVMIPTDEMFRRDREKAKNFYPIYREIFGYVGTVSLLDPKDIEMVLSTTKHIQKGDVYNLLHLWLGTGLLTSDGAKWQTRRKILTPAFHFSILQEFIHIFNEGTMSLLHDLEKEASVNPVINVISLVTEFTLHAITETSMGRKLNVASTSGRNYKNAIYDFGQIVTYRMTRPWFQLDNLFFLTPAGRRAKETVKTLHNFTTNVIKEKKRKLHNSPSYTIRKRLAMLDLLLKAEEDGEQIDEKGIREEVDTFMFEGHDTTSIAICFILMLLANHKNIQDEIYQEIIEVLGDSNALPNYSDLQELKFTERCLKECLRLYPSVPFIARTASEDFKTESNYTIPKGTMVHVHIYDLHRLPNIFPDPEKFDPDRFLPENISRRHPFAYIPFSAGPRNCIGQKFAMLELKTVVCGILRKFVLKPVDTPRDIVCVTDLVLRTKNGIKVKFVARIV